ncbi:LysE family translocator [Vibrio gazogenes]|uniref:Threonine/homoserine/homoserine lactone efflux protein n=1 Tax=Vibrio gazogenes DSM 21264 = NBRC 103151 TaxID=1123492 RepID=A0A1M5HUY6_VIBGA|nr:LysE family translocator [Vibrio gazogenes]USP12762.1 LysE family translocator [Vibrio gazogenes]SHG19520.1 Threonine/homoserine/homoserine lactone efflux protein [Vibrio gazogenes DSM 21264] [Vibrio gazogenes DSM 21264 = NBRC 103151]SHG19760.1 Threonine/homoserine/homoserine lactone efflux protein [Vibrio gazogenes DSM 21264] [Vibrio gazogenes DSM 21264 = NBRC 103151]SJN57518.1 Threonine efflux protein [Vibrio gazogenes]
MDIHNVITFIAVATLLVISPGPNGFLIAKTVPLSGQKAGFANIFGFVAAFYVHGTLSIFGISVLLVQSAQAFFILKILGAIYLIWIGIKSLISAFKVSNKKLPNLAQRDIKPISMCTAFSEGFLTNVLNPKVSMFYLSAFPQFISTNEGVMNAYALVTAHSIVNFMWFSAMVFMLSRIKKSANNAQFKKWLNSITGIVFIGFGSKLALMKNG